MILWRISNYANLDGAGGLYASARWHSRGHRIVYLAQSPAGALAEVLVHLELDADDLPKTYKLLKAEAPDELAIEEVALSQLPENWRENTSLTRTIGDEWLEEKATALLKVPSAIVPETFNVLLNPEHREAKRVKILSHEQYPWDKRLLL